MQCTSCGSELLAGARFCGMCGMAVKQAPQRERRLVSAVFIDLAGFTTLTLGLDAEAVRDLADAVLTTISGIIEQFSGHVDAFRGDGLIAVFGAPRSYADDAERAVNAAAAALRAIERIGSERGIELKGRAGVATGVVIAGELGSGRVREYTVMGSAMNLAARIESACTPGEVWVSPATYEATHNRMNFRPSGPVHLAGFPDVNELYILRSNPEPATADPFAHLKFVGRQAELTWLASMLREVRDSSRFRAVWLAGDTGVGKTRLLHELVQDQRTLGALVLWPAERSGAALSWHAMARAMFAGLDAGGSLPSPAVIEETLERLLADEPRWRRQIMASLGLVELKPYTRLERRAVNRTSLAWRDLLVALAHHEQRPVLVVLENEVLDDELLEFIGLLQEAEAPILLVRVTRSREPLTSGEWLELPPLTMAESLELLNQVADPVMRRATEALVYQVAGIPAYILELGRALSVAEDSSFSGSLEALLQARLDRLEQSDRQLLALAAISGERSWESQLIELGGPAARPALERMLAENILLQLPESRIPAEVELRFQSELLRHAVLRMVPFSDRPLAHLRIATWLESRAPFELSELIARHFRAGGSHDAAWPHYLAAMEQAARTDSAQVTGLIRDVSELQLPAEQKLLASLAAADAALVAGEPGLARELLKEAAAMPIQTPSELQGVPQKLAALEQQLDRLEAEPQADHDAEQKPGSEAGQMNGPPDGDAGAGT